MSTLKIHKNDKPYTCTFISCQKTFREKGNMITHLKLHVILLTQYKKKTQENVNEDNESNSKLHFEERTKTTINTDSESLKNNSEDIDSINYNQIVCTSDCMIKQEYYNPNFVCSNLWDDVFNFNIYNEVGFTIDNIME
jgi:hypothetical protein